MVHVDNAHETVLVVDFGAQYAQLIARRVREACVYSEIVPNTISINEIAQRAPKQFSLAAPNHAHRGHPLLTPAFTNSEYQFLGSVTALNSLHNSWEEPLTAADVANTAEPKFTSPTRIAAASPGSSRRRPGMDVSLRCNHRTPEGFHISASTNDAPAALIENPDRRLYGVQYHPEVVHTPHGQQLLERFLIDVAECQADWTMTNVIEESVTAIRQQVGQGRAICGLSGGVDSAVAAALVHQAIGAQLVCVFVDTGLMRLGEGDQVVETFQRTQGIELIHERSADVFFEALEGVTDPEDKRKIIGEKFIRIFEQAQGGIEDAHFLVQGTLYPDVIESGTDEAAK